MGSVPETVIPRLFSCASGVPLIALFFKQFGNLSDWELDKINRIVIGIWLEQDLLLTFNPGADEINRTRLRKFA